MSDWSFLDFSNTGAVTCDFPTDSTTTVIYEPLRDWLPNSCLHEKYIPTWHLVRSYK